MPDPNDILLSFYGDDFTGSTDVMESLSSMGIPAALFLQPPAPSEVQDFRLLHRETAEDGKLRAFGVPGIARSLSPSEMEQQLPPIFQAIQAVPSRFFHYKTCSTFDSAPEVGNIAVATDIALACFPSSFIPLLVGAPALGRFCVFGNLFARVDGQTYRLDRHPTMARHPVTPMSESDLRRHLQRLGPRPCRSIDLFQLQAKLHDRLSTLLEAAGSDTPYLLFDTLDQDSLLNAGELLYHGAQPAGQLVVGSSGVEYALGHYLRNAGHAAEAPSYSVLGPAERIVALSGSAAPASQAQIEHALAIGFADIRIQTSDIVDPAKRDAEIERVVRRALAALERGRSPMIYAARGPNDPAIERTKAAAQSHGQRPGPAIAKAQGQILKAILSQTTLRRAVVAGGDTSGYAASALDLYALEMRLPIAPGAPLCLAHSNNPDFHGLEIALKGGQNGNRLYFESILKGASLSPVNP